MSPRLSDEVPFASGELVSLTRPLNVVTRVSDRVGAAASADAETPPGGTPALKLRRELSTPISPGPLSDTALYEDAKDPGRKYYLPRYRVGEEVVSGKTQYRLALKTQGTSWIFVVGLEKFPAPEIALEARDAKELPHEIQVVLTHRLFINDAPTGVRERPFAKVDGVASGVEAVLMLPTLEDRDELYRALTESTYGANLEVRRKVEAAVQAPLPDGGAYTVSAGTLQLNPGQSFDVVAGTAGDAGHVVWTSNREIAPRGDAQLANLGARPFDALAVGDLRAAAYARDKVTCERGFGADAVVFITPHWNPPGMGGVYEKQPLGVWFTGKQWSVFNQDMQAMPPNAGFVVVPVRPGGDATVHHAEPPKPAWGPWLALDRPAAAFAGAPSIVSQVPGTSNVYVRGRDNALWQAAFGGGQWHGWARHEDGGRLTAEPAADSMGPGHEHVFVRGLDGQIWQKWWTAGVWSRWIALGAPPVGFTDRPATISRGPGICNVYVRGNDNALWHLAYYSGQWHPWDKHRDGAVLASPPAAGSLNQNHEHVFVRGTDGQVWIKSWTSGGGWSGWVALGAPPPGFVGGPATVARDANNCSVYVRGQDQALWQRAWSAGVWSDWIQHDPAIKLVTDPGADSQQGGHEHVFAQGMDQQLWHRTWPGAQTTGNIAGNWTRIDHPALDGKPNALCQVTQNWNPPGYNGVYNACNIGVWYTGSNWAVFNQSLAAMPVGASFNVRLTPEGERSFVHRAAADNISGHVTTIRHPLLDGQADRRLLVTPNWNPGGAGGVYNNHPIGIWWTGANWTIFNQDIVAMPPGAAFNVEIVDVPEAFIHVARPETISGNFTTMPLDDATSMNFVMSIRTPDDDFAKVQVLDSRTALNLRWMTLSDAPRYREETANLDLTKLRDSFVFPPNLYAYIFRGIEDVDPGKPGLVRHSVPFEGMQYPYYQDGVRRQVFFHLPDAFKLARKAGTRRFPDMVVRVGSPDRALEDSTASVTYVAVAVSNPKRLAGALQALRAFVPADAGEPVLEPLRPSKLTFKLGVPRAGSTGVTFVEQPDALVTMSSIRHSVVVSTEAFQAVFQALFSTSSLIFQGQVEVTLGGDEAVPPIPFEAKMSDLAGDPVTCTVTRDGSRFDATLTNVIESVVRVHAVTIGLKTPGEAIMADAVGLTLPADIAAGQKLSFGLRPHSAVPANAPIDAIFDFAALEVIPVQEAVWDAIIDTTVAPEYMREVRIKTVAEMFKGAEPRVTLIRVNLKREGGAVVAADLTETHLEEVGRLRAPLRDFILGTGDAGEFLYQVVAVRGDMRSTSAFKTATSDLLITSEDLA